MTFIQTLCESQPVSLSVLAAPEGGEEGFSVSITDDSRVSDLSGARKLKNIYIYQSADKAPFVFILCSQPFFPFVLAVV